MFTLILLLSINIIVASDNTKDNFGKEDVSKNSLPSTQLESLISSLTSEQLAEIMKGLSANASHKLDEARRANLEQEAINSQIFTHYHQTVFITLNPKRSIATENHKQWAEISSSSFRNPYVIFEHYFDSNEQDGLINLHPHPSTGYHAETSRDPKNDRRERIDSPHHWPYLLHGKLIITFKKKNGKIVKDVKDIGSASVIGRHHVLTAGHCILDKYDGLGYATEITFLYAIPTQENPHESFTWKAIKGTHAFTVSGWKNRGKPDCDYGIIVLKDPVELPPKIALYETRENTFYPQSPQNSMPPHFIKQKFGLSTVEQLNDHRYVNIAGFPQYCPEDILVNDPEKHDAYSSFGLITAEEDMLIYDIDVSRGQSGSLVWINKSLSENEQGYYGIGIHTQGYDRKETAGRNKAVRLTLSHLKNIIAWIKGYPS